MNKALDEKLCTRWPAIFRDRHGNPEETAMARGFECGDGWYQLIDLTCAALQREADLHDAPLPVARQVKEKLGTLRFRLKEASERQKAILDFAQDFSAYICEE